MSEPLCHSIYLLSFLPGPYREGSNKKTAVPSKETAAFNLVGRALPTDHVAVCGAHPTLAIEPHVRSKSREHKKSAITGRYSDLRLTSKLLPIRHKLICGQWTNVSRISESRNDADIEYCHCEEQSDEAISTLRKPEIATPSLCSGSQ